MKLRACFFKFAASFKMPPVAAALILGIPVAIVVALAVMRADGVRLNIDWLYYPTFGFVYAIWILPILAFMLFSVRQIAPNPPGTSGASLSPLTETVSDS